MNMPTRQIPHVLGVGAVLALVLLPVLPAGAVELRSGENVIIQADEIVRDDLYMTGDTMTVRGRVTGDVVASGRMIVIEGEVEGDLIAAAQAIIIRGTVTDDVRIAGMALKLASGSRVGDDTFAAGFSIESEPGSRVEGKTGITGYQASLAGDHLQGLEASLVALRIAGLVRGDVETSVDSQAGPAWWTRFMRSPVPLPEVGPGLEISDTARVEGDLAYTSVAKARVGSLAVVTGELRQQVPSVRPTEEPGWSTRVGRSTRWLVTLFLLGAAGLWLFSDRVMGLTQVLEGRPVASLGWGFVALLGFPVAILLIAVLASVTTMAFGMISLGPGAVLVMVLGLLAVLLLATVLWVSAFYLAPVIVSLAGGRQFLGRGASGVGRRYLSLLLGLVLLMILSLIPFLGVIVKAGTVLLGIGAGALWTLRYRATTDGH